MVPTGSYGGALPRLFILCAFPLPLGLRTVVWPLQPHPQFGHGSVQIFVAHSLGVFERPLRRSQWLSLAWCSPAGLECKGSQRPIPFGGSLGLLYRYTERSRGAGLRPGISFKSMRPGRIAHISRSPVLGGMSPHNRNHIDTLRNPRPFQGPVLTILSGWGESRNIPGSGEGL